jgi:hypothetical protein
MADKSNAKKAPQATLKEKRAQKKERAQESTVKARKR